MTAKTRAVLALGLAQTMAWGGSYYIPAILAAPIARDLGMGVPMVYAVFSGALLLSAFVGPASGRLIDRHGGHWVLAASNLLMGAGLLTLGLAQGLPGLLLAWALLGLGMGIGLYEAAFATLARLFGTDARGPITGITLFAGFASTVAWPLTTWLEAALGWRGACLVWAGIMPVLGLLLNLWLLPRQPAPAMAAASARQAGPPPGLGALILLAFVFAVAGFTSSAMAAHLPGLLALAGAGAATVVLAGALLGPAQVAARLLEFGLLRRWNPLVGATLANALHPLGVLALLVLSGPSAAIIFVLLHGAGNGMLTVSRGTLPLALFGAAGYGARTGWLAMPARFANAAAPALFGLMLEWWGMAALSITAALGLAAMLALLALSRSSGPTPR